MSDQIQDVEQKTTVVGKAVFPAFNKPTPMWATWMFRIFYHISTVVGIWLAATNLVPEADKFEILLIVSAVDRVVWGIARGIGIDKNNFSDPSNQPS